MFYYRKAILMSTKEIIRPNFKCYNKARLSWLLLNIRVPFHELRMLQKPANRPKLFDQPLKNLEVENRTWVRPLSNIITNVSLEMKFQQNNVHTTELSYCLKYQLELEHSLFKHFAPRWLLSNFKIIFSRSLKTLPNLSNPFYQNLVKGNTSLIVLRIFTLIFHVIYRI